MVAFAWILWHKYSLGANPPGGQWTLGGNPQAFESRKRCQQVIGTIIKTRLRQGSKSSMKVVAVGRNGVKLSIPIPGGTPPFRVWQQEHYCFPPAFDSRGK